MSLAEEDPKIKQCHAKPSKWKKCIVNVLGLENDDFEQYQREFK